MQKQERNKRTMQALFNEAMNSGDLSAADKYITPERPDHDPAFGRQQVYDITCQLNNGLRQ